jgi:hypothetical protein
MADESLLDQLLRLKRKIDEALEAADPDGSGTPSPALIEAYVRMHREV